MKTDIAWPWCEACHSWHHPENPTCRFRDPLWLQDQVIGRIHDGEIKQQIKWGMIIASIVIGAIVATLLGMGVKP